MEQLSILVRRLEKIGITLELRGNYPWVYLHSVNGNIVKEKFNSEHGWVICIYPIRIEDKGSLTDLSEIFKIVKKYGT